MLLPIAATGLPDSNSDYWRESSKTIEGKSGGIGPFSERGNQEWENEVQEAVKECNGKTCDAGCFSSLCLTSEAGVRLFSRDTSAL